MDQLPDWVEGHMRNTSKNYSAIEPRHLLDGVVWGERQARFFYHLLRVQLGSGEMAFERPRGQGPRVDPGDARGKSGECVSAVGPRHGRGSHGWLLGEDGGCFRSDPQASDGGGPPLRSSALVSRRAERRASPGALGSGAGTSRCSAPVEPLSSDDRGLHLQLNRVEQTS